MKYMGSKRMMLRNGLGTLLDRELKSATRFVDLFAGSGAVAAHVATRSEIPVLAYDLQTYSSLLTGAILNRSAPVDGARLWKAWHRRASKAVRGKPALLISELSPAQVLAARRWCSRQKKGVITKAYGGHYFSPEQAIWLDSLLESLPRRKPERTIAHAALIQAASRCAAAPGHTAQPFQPTKTAIEFLESAWRRNILKATESSVVEISAFFAKRVGRAEVGDANIAASGIRSGDLVFIDPPYSGVHYSRFYHVLETIARGKCGEVTGIGRYPSQFERPCSRYSILTKAPTALNELLAKIAGKGAKAILTFPAHDCSNGLSGTAVRRIARRHFRIKSDYVKSLFSTLGGRGDDKQHRVSSRKARHIAKELMLVLEPKPAPAI